LKTSYGIKAVKGATPFASALFLSSKIKREELQEWLNKGWIKKRVIKIRV